MEKLSQVLQRCLDNASDVCPGQKHLCTPMLRFPEPPRNVPGRVEGVMGSFSHILQSDPTSCWPWAYTQHNPWPQGTHHLGEGHIGGPVVLGQCGQCSVETSPRGWGYKGIQSQPYRGGELWGCVGVGGSERHEVGEENVPA